MEIQSRIMYILSYMWPSEKQFLHEMQMPCTSTSYSRGKKYFRIRMDSDDCYFPQSDLNYHIPDLILSKRTLPI